MTSVLTKAIGAGSTFDKAAYTAYETVKAERNALKEAENVYKKRIVALEEETQNLLQSYQGIYAENKVLRSKVEHGPDAQRIRNYRNEIKKLEEKVEILKSENALLRDETLAIQKEVNILTADKKRIEEAFKMERGLHADKNANLENENKSLKKSIDQLDRQKKEYELRIVNYENECEGLVERYKQIKRDNLKIETKFKTQKSRLEEDLKETKGTNVDISKEIIQLKTKLAKLQSDYFCVKLDYEAAQKQIDYQNKELEVFKTQSTLLRRNVKVTTREYNTMKEELKTVEDMLEDAKGFGFDNLIDERKHLRRKENKFLQQIENLEMKVEELVKENIDLENELNECRKRMEAAIMEKQDMLLTETALKRRIEALENANIELDRQKFYAGKKINGVHVTISKENIKNLEKEKTAMLARSRFLENQNRKLDRRIRELENGDISEIEEDFTVYTFRSKSRKSGESGKMIHAEMPSLNTQIDNTSYKKKMKTSRSFPG